MKTLRWISFLFLIVLLGGCDAIVTGLEELAEGTRCAPPAGGSIATSFGRTSYDQLFKDEVRLQKAFFRGVSADVHILNEGDPRKRNAYATHDGCIFFGYYMFHHVVSTYNELAAAGVLAHEWGHRTQFTFNWQTANPHMELEADAFSGYYMALAKHWAWSRIQGYYNNVYATGDYLFNDPTHHGTPSQRLAAAYLGVQTAILAMQNNRAFSYAELHQVFMTEIRGRIAGKAGAAEKTQGLDALPEASREMVEEALQTLESVELEAIATGVAQGDEVAYPERSGSASALRPFVR